MAKAKKPRNRAAQDITLIQLRVLKRRLNLLEAQAWLPPEILKQLHQLDRRVAVLEKGKR